MATKFDQNKLHKIVSDINHDTDEDTAIVLGASDISARVAHWLPSGMLGVDCIMGGGVPVGRMIEIFGGESSGKSSLAYSILAQTQKQGGIAVLIDTENSFDPDRAADLGLSAEELIYCTPGYMENVFTQIESVIKACRKEEFDAPVCVAWDSIAATPCKSELQGDFGDSVMAIHARLMSQALRKISTQISKLRIALVFVNQVREKIGVMYGEHETTFGGRALPFYASVRCKVRLKERLKDSKGEVYGIQSSVKCVKNKVAPPFKETFIHFLWGEHSQDDAEVYNLFAILEEAKLLKRSGSWYKLPDESISFQRNNLVEVARDNPALLPALRVLVAGHYGMEVNDE